MLIIVVFFLLFCYLPIVYLDILDKKAKEKRLAQMRKKVIESWDGVTKKSIGGYEIDTGLFKYSRDKQCREIGYWRETGEATYLHNDDCKCGWRLDPSKIN